MKLFFSRSIVFLTVLALMFSIVPGALAETSAEETELNSLLTAPTTEAPAEEAGSEEEVPAEEPPVEEEPPVLIPVGGFSEGMIRVTDGVRWGYASAGGTLLIPVQFDSAENFELGVAKVTVDGKVGLLHWNGELLFAPEYDELSKVGYGIYLGRRGELWDLLCTTAEPSRVLYSDLIEANVSDGVNGQLFFREGDGKVTRVLVRNLPQWMQGLKVDGWQFPLVPNKVASFVDVSGQDWFDRWVDLAYCIGMMEGTGGNRFEPMKELTVAETLRLAACLESRALQDDFHLQAVSGAQWYRSSVTYCETVGIIGYNEFANEDFNRPVTRAEMARIFSRTTAVRGMEQINDMSLVRTSVPDVQEGDYAAEAIYGMYAKGIFNGKDLTYAFHPGENLTRAEAATMVARIARPEHRVILW